MRHDLAADLKAIRAGATVFPDPDPGVRTEYELHEVAEHAIERALKAEALAQKLLDVLGRVIPSYLVGRLEVDLDSVLEANGLLKRDEEVLDYGPVELLGGGEKMSEIQERAITAVLLERKRQDSKWGEQNHPPHYWTGILGEEYGELCEAINETVFDNWSDKGGFENMRREAIHVAAVAIGFLECLERNKALWFSSPTQGGREKGVLGDEN